MGGKHVAHNHRFHPRTVSSALFGWVDTLLPVSGAGPTGADNFFRIVCWSLADSELEQVSTI
jgi:hypothetical protein